MSLDMGRHVKMNHSSTWISVHQRIALALPLCAGMETQTPAVRFIDARDEIRITHDDLEWRRWS